MQGYQQRPTTGLPGCQPLCCREAAYGFFDSVQLADPFQGLLRQRRGRANVHIVDLAAGVSPAGCFRYLSIAVQLVEPCVRIRLQNAAEAHKMALRVDAFSVRAVGEPHCRCQP